MTYSFDCRLAEKYGVDEAIFLHNLYFWIVRKNEANGRHHHEGRTWTYNSMAAFARLFPFGANGRWSGSSAVWWQTGRCWRGILMRCPMTGQSGMPWETR